ncbi:MAG: MerR family transcriptional regulator [Armatimonadaceae bacterium]
MLLRIGSFAKLCQVSERTLRFYEKEGLLKPSQVDDATGYRYYDTDLLPRVQRILALRDLKLSLKEIRAVLFAGRASTEVLTRMLTQKQIELAEWVQAEQERLRRVEARLCLLKQEGEMSEYEVMLKSVPAMTVVAIRETIPSMEQLSTYLDRNFRALEEYVRVNNGEMAGPAFEIWHYSEGCGFTGKNMDVEACYPVAKPLSNSEPVHCHTLPAIDTMATVIHHGPYSKLSEAHDAIHGWIAANGYKVVGGDRCVYHEHHRNGNPDDNIAEVQYPVQKQ